MTPEQRRQIDMANALLKALEPAFSHGMHPLDETAALVVLAGFCGAYAHARVAEGGEFLFLADLTRFIAFYLREQGRDIDPDQIVPVVVDDADADDDGRRH